MKGELERDIKNLSFRNIHILQPGLLEGDRVEKRWMETLASKALHFMNGIGLLKKQKPLPASVAAKAMINASLFNKAPVQTYALLDIFKLAD
jgi:hypothetical protein